MLKRRANVRLCLSAPALIIQDVTKRLTLKALL